MNDNRLIYRLWNYTYQVHTFTSSGTFNVTTLGNGLVQLLVVAGGGGGGGGGAGGFVYNSSYAVSLTSYTTIVGTGGNGQGTFNGVSGINGANSQFDIITGTGEVVVLVALQ